MRIKIRSGAATAEIDTKGAELKSYQDHLGKEYIWNGDPKHWKGSSPILFPMIGNLRNESTIINGEKYHIKKHGFARDHEFQVLEQTESKAVFSFSYSEETLASFPFQFNLRLTYVIEDTVLTLTYDVYNIDKVEMCFHIGAHPAFNCPLQEGEVFSDYVLKFEKSETCMAPVYDLENFCISNDNRICRLNNSDTLPLDYSMFQNDAIIFDDIKSRKVSLLNPSTGRGVSVDYNGFDVIAFWTPMKDTAPFLCIEPWNGSAIYSDEDDEFIHKRCIQLVKQGERRTYQLIFNIL